MIAKYDVFMSTFTTIRNPETYQATSNQWMVYKVNGFKTFKLKVRTKSLRSVFHYLQLLIEKSKMTHLLTPSIYIRTNFIDCKTIEDSLLRNENESKELKKPNLSW